MQGRRRAGCPVVHTAPDRQRRPGAIAVIVQIQELCHGGGAPATTETPNFLAPRQKFLTPPLMRTIVSRSRI